ncbi:MAG: hypothetical protein AB8G22_24840, partial [Saprospiraceae bacterium]
MPASIILREFFDNLTAAYDNSQSTLSLDEDIDPLFVQLLGYVKRTYLELTEVNPPQFNDTETQVIVAGKGQLFIECNTIQLVRIVGFIVDNQLQLKLIASHQEDLDIHVILPELAGSKQAVGAFIEPVESLFYELDYQNASWQIITIAPEVTIYPALGLNLSADIPITEHAPLLVSMTGKETLSFQGPVLYNANNTTENDPNWQNDVADRQLYIQVLLPTLTIHTGPLALNNVNYLLRTTYYSDEPSANISGSVLSGIIDIDNLPAIEVGVDIQQGNDIWTFYSNMEEPLTLNHGLTALAEFVGGNPANFVIPDSIRLLNDFGLTRLDIGIDPSNWTDVGFVFLEVMSNKTWYPPLPYISIKDLYVQWQIISPFDSPDQSGGFGGTLTFGEGDHAVDLDVGAILPHFAIEANLREGEVISLLHTMQVFFPSITETGFSQDVQIDQLHIGADFYNQTYELQGAIAPVPSLTLDLIFTQLELEHTYFKFNYNQKNLYGTLSARLGLLDAYWMVVASYSENKDWLFSFFLEKDEKLSLNDI